MEIITILGRHGCPDITGDIDLSQCSSKPIAGGGFGDIYRGALQSGAQVAIKCPRVYLDDNQKNRDALKVRIFGDLNLIYHLNERNYLNCVKTAAREIYTWSKCKHDHVLELSGLAYFRDHLAMVSPWMQYGTLPQYLVRHPNSDRCDIVGGLSNTYRAIMTLRLQCIQIASGLAYLHLIDIVRRIDFLKRSVESISSICYLFFLSFRFMATSKG